MHKEQVFKIALSAAILVATMVSFQAFAGPHDAGYYKCNAQTGITYWRYSKKRSDAQETAFKQAVTNVAGIGKGCRSVSYPSKEPEGTEI